MCNLFEFVSQSLEHFDHLVHLHFTFDLVFSGANVHGAILHLGFSNHQLEVVLGNLGVSDLLLEGGLGKIHVSVHARLVELLSNAVGVFPKVLVDGNDHGLSRADPEGPLSAPVFAQDCEHALYTSQHGTVHNNGTGELLALFLRIGGVFQIETNGELEIELDGGTLVDAIHGIHDLDIDLGTVKGTISGIHPPVALAIERVEGLLERCLGLVPQFSFS
mmetsp:Transcript_9468/g.23585  ORF Transcript_9468/g.23585 Transcript_9468/m.23585 type:complete len:219 (+) Transcript_9468:50-706(+)